MATTVSGRKEAITLRGVITRCAVTVVDQIEAALSEAGEIIDAIESKLIDTLSLLEIGSLLKTTFPELKKRLTVFKSVGLAIQDISIADMVYKNALKNQVGY